MVRNPIVRITSFRNGRGRRSQRLALAALGLHSWDGPSVCLQPLSKLWCDSSVLLVAHWWQSSIFLSVFNLRELEAVPSSSTYVVLSAAATASPEHED
mmetsp:Transcript_33030/g.64034  ORF Transcript_33030/g.64034 Transcript_33030/m.64034 type:complete len:98 (+) Transcript_33030:74-367(+)